MPKKNLLQDRWVLAYYMSYDNNLSHCTPIILEQLEVGVKDTNTVVTVLSDDREQVGLKRYEICAQGRQVEVLLTENSASEEVLDNYLQWVGETYPARHYGLIFLDHGGRLDQMCLDEWPGKNEKKNWLSAQLVGPVLKRFSEQVSGSFDLLFLQQCGRASLENLYNFRGVAKTIMASQTNVGAPNTYYASTLQWLGNKTNVTGKNLAHRIMLDDNHFAIYVCVDGEKVIEIPNQLTLVINRLIEKSLLLSVPSGNKPCYSSGEEHNYDLLAWLESAFEENHVEKGAFDEFSLWLQYELITGLRVHPMQNKVMKDYCGISLFVPATKELFELYRDYPIYQDSGLIKLWQKIFLETTHPSFQ